MPLVVRLRPKIYDFILLCLGLSERSGRMIVMDSREGAAEDHEHEGRVSPITYGRS